MSNPLKPRLMQFRETERVVGARVRVEKAWRLVTWSTVKQRTNGKKSRAMTSKLALR